MSKTLFGVGSSPAKQTEGQAFETRVVDLGAPRVPNLDDVASVLEQFEEKPAEFAQCRDNGPAPHFCMDTESVQVRDVSADVSRTTMAEVIARIEERSSIEASSADIRAFIEDGRRDV